MRNNTHRRLLVALLVLAIVVGPATAAVSADAPAAETAEGLTQSGAVMAAGDLNQTDSGALEFELDAERVGNDSAVDVRFASDGGDDTLTTTAENPDTDDVYRYRVASADLPDFPLGNTNITVSRGNGDNRTDFLTETGVDLRHLDIADGRASFDDSGQLTLTATDDTAGLNGSSFDLAATADGDDRSATLSATLENGTVTIDRNDAFTGLLAPPATLTLAAADGGPSVTGDTGVSLADVDSDATVLVSPGRVTVQSPLLVGGTEYGVHLETTGPDGEYATMTTARESDGVTSVTVENEYVAGIDNVTIDVTTAGSAVLSETYESGAAAAATVDDGQRSVTLREATFAGADVSFVLLSTEDGIRVVSDAAVDGGTLSLNGLPEGLGLDRNGSYRMVVAFADAPATTVAVGDGGRISPLVEPTNRTETGGSNTTTTGSGNESSTGGLFGGLPGGQFTLGLLAGFVVLLVLGVGYAVGQSLGDDSSGGAGGSTQTRDVRVRITDGFANEQLSDEVYLTARPSGQSSASTSGVNRDGGGREETVDGGVVTWTLDAEPYEFTASYNGATVTETADLLDDRLTLSFQPVSKRVSVIDETGEPVRDATVTATFDGERVTERTNENGQVSLTLPMTASGVEVTAEHERYEPDTRQVSDPENVPSELRVVGKTGTLRVETAIGGEPTDEVDMNLDTNDEWLKERLRESSPTDRGDNAVGLPAGEYTLVGSVDGGPFEDVRSRVTVPEDDTAAVTLDVPFEFELSATQRESLEALRRDADDLLPGGRLDSAVHSYYASVARSLGDAVERVPESGVRFAETGVDPDPVVDAMLSAGRGCVEGVDNAMNTKHNVDLFSACSDMREVSEEWRADYDLDDFFELAAADRVSQRAELKSRLSEAESTVEDHRGEVNVISPASDVLEELRAYEGDTRESDEVRNAAFVFAVAGFVESVSELFEHPRLLDRLNRTMY